MNIVFIVQATPAVVNYCMCKWEEQNKFGNKENRLYQLGNPVSNILRGDQVEISNITEKKKNFFQAYKLDFNQTEAMSI